jgi:hypothetical protein
MAKGFKDPQGKFRPTENKNGVRKSRDKTTIPTQGVRLKRSERKLKPMIAENIELRDVRDHPLYEESTNWLDVFESTPEVIVADEENGHFFIWYGGESHYVHYVSPDGREYDVFSFGFDKNRLDKDEVLEMINERLGEKEEDED